ncbi:MAG TPA: hypothetical protein VKR38_03100, partial [Usitatibacter sp.]|nr:hypothetical protein [Usitatibacter sp.]
MERQSILEVTSPALVTVFVLAIASHTIGGIFPGEQHAELLAWTTLAWELPRAFVVVWAGWLVCVRGGGGIARAGVGGILAFFVSHPVA